VKFHSEVHVRDLLLLKAHVTRLLKQHTNRSDRILKAIQLLTERITDMMVFVKKLGGEDVGQRKEVKGANALSKAPSTLALASSPALSELPADYINFFEELGKRFTLDIQSTLSKRFDEIDSKLSKVDEIDSKLNSLIGLIQQSPKPVIQQSANSNTCCLAQGQRGNNLANRLLPTYPVIALQQ